MTAWTALLLLTTATVLGALPGCATNHSEFDVRFGRVGILWDGDQPYQALIEETHIVPRDIGGETAVGYVIEPRTNDPYETYSVHRLPTVPPNLGSSSSMSVQEDGSIRTSTDTVRGSRVFSFGFDEGDPVGSYEIDVYVNDQLAGSAVIDVVDAE